MPTVFREKGYRFYFWSNERNEPPHVHVQQAERYAKFWLSPVRLQRNSKFRQNELTKLHQIIEEHGQQLLESWHEHFTSQAGTDRG